MKRAGRFSKWNRAWLGSRLYRFFCGSRRAALCGHG
nr:MAG TPA: hypothetical protein [Caudoviricetes sp.]